MGLDFVGTHNNNQAKSQLMLIRNSEDLHPTAKLPLFYNNTKERKYSTNNDKRGDVHKRKEQRG